MAMKKNIYFSVSPITLDDVFVYLVNPQKSGDLRTQ
jgi:hypothetical protein